MEVKDYTVAEMRLTYRNPQRLEKRVKIKSPYDVYRVFKEFYRNNGQNNKVMKEEKNKQLKPMNPDEVREVVKKYMCGHLKSVSERKSASMSGNLVTFYMPAANLVKSDTGKFVA